MQVVHLIYIVHHVWHRLFGQVCNGMNGCQFHLFVNGCCMNVQRTSEDVGETYDVVNLVGIVSTARRHEYIRACLDSIFVGYLWHGVGQCKDDGILGHGLHHLFR